MNQISFVSFAQSVARPAIRILAAAFALSAICAALRIKMVYYAFETLSDAARIVWKGLRNSYFDMAVVYSATGACLLALLVMMRWRRLGEVIAWLFCGFAILCVLLACVNIVTVGLTGGSLTFQWIYYADLFRSFTSRSVVRPVFNASFFALVGFSLAGWLAIYMISWVSLRLIQRSGLLLPVLLLGFLLLAGYFVRVSNHPGLAEVWRGHITNPLLELVTTAIAVPAGGLLRAEDPIVQPQLPSPIASPNLLPAGLRTGSIRNVVLVVMESVGAHYVAGTGPAEAVRWTPRIASYGASTVAFRNVYTHVPLSTKSLFSILTSRYPFFSYEVETTRRWSGTLQSLSGRLKGAGIRTAFFMSGDFEFQYVDAFLDGRGFDLRSDMRSIPCAMPKYVSPPEWPPHLDSVDDHCTAQALIRWIDAEPEQPFFALLWTGNTHWPYFVTEKPAPGTFASDPHLDRYLGAVRSSDAAIGSVLDHLMQHGLLDSTLVVVTGDHGEAFGEHGLRVHGNSIYEEETRIPLLLINPRITTPEPNNTIGGLIDIAPTILHVLGLQPEATWEGRSLFDPNRADRVFLFAPNHAMVAGYRQGHYKFMYQVARAKALVYDLANDPAEKRNIADEHSARAIRRQLTGWFEQQQRRIKADIEQP